MQCLHSRDQNTAGYAKLKNQIHKQGFDPGRGDLYAMIFEEGMTPAFKKTEKWLACKTCASQKQLLMAMLKAAHIGVLLLDGQCVTVLT